MSSQKTLWQRCEALGPIELGSTSIRKSGIGNAYVVRVYDSVFFEIDGSSDIEELYSDDKWLAESIITHFEKAKKREKTCEYCGARFLPKYKTVRFCCQSHASSYIAMQKGENPKQQRKCAHCGKKFLRYDPPSQKRIRTFYCSKACMIEHTSRVLADPQKQKQKERMKRWMLTPKGKESRQREAKKRWSRLNGQASTNAN